MLRPTEEATWGMREAFKRVPSPPTGCPNRSQSHFHLCRCYFSSGSDLAGCWKNPPAPQTVAREARDMRERRDVDRLDSRLVPLVAPFPLVSHVSRANIVFSQPT